MKYFIRDNTGAVTVDWAILTAAIVAMGLGLLIAVDLATSTQVSNIASEIQKAND